MPLLVSGTLLGTQATTLNAVCMELSSGWVVGGPWTASGGGNGPFWASGLGPSPHSVSPILVLGPMYTAFRVVAWVPSYVLARVGVGLGPDGGVVEGARFEDHFLKFRARRCSHFLPPRPHWKLHLPVIRPPQPCYLSLVELLGP